MLVKCKHCGYRWNYNGKRSLTNCPKCGYKVFFSTEKEESQTPILGKTKHTVRLDTDEDRIRLMPMGDIHRGAPEGQCMWNKVQSELDYILNTPNSYMIGMGDYTDCAQSIRSRGPKVHLQSMIPQEQYDKILEAFRPLAEAGKILGLHSGNHEDWIFETGGIYIVKMLSDSLGVPLLGPGCETTIRVNKQKYLMYTQHGVSGARMGYTKLNALAKATKDIFADLFLMGHVHHIACQKGGKRYGGKQIKCYYVLTGHFLNWEGSYAQMFGYDVAPPGCPTVKLFSDRHDVHVSI